MIRTAVPDLDRESQERYEVVIQATDMAGQLGGLSGSTTVTIVVTDVNDNPPRFPQSKWGSVSVCLHESLLVQLPLELPAWRGTVTWVLLQACLPQRETPANLVWQTEKLL